MKEKLGNFYGSLNTIIHIEGQSDDMVILRLLESHCLPILTYGIEVIHVVDVEGKCVSPTTPSTGNFSTTNTTKV